MIIVSVCTITEHFWLIRIYAVFITRIVENIQDCTLKNKHIGNRWFMAYGSQACTSYSTHVYISQSAQMISSFKTLFLTRLISHYSGTLQPFQRSSHHSRPPQKTPYPDTPGSLLSVPTGFCWHTRILV